MTDREALEEACRRDPTNDLPRLVFADWLDEHDEAPRADFIRVQCEIARMTAASNPSHPEEPPLGICLRKGRSGVGTCAGCRACLVWKKEYARLREREHALFIEFGAQWLGDLYDKVVAPHHAWETESGPDALWIYRRGWPARWRCSMLGWTGGECPGCDAAGGHGYATCALCCGTGQIEPIGPRLVRSPLCILDAGGIYIMDKQARREDTIHGIPRRGGFWHSEFSDSVFAGEACVLPNPIWEELPTDERVTDNWVAGVDLVACYKSGDAARKALGIACIRWALGEVV